MKKILSNLFILAVTIFMVTSCDENYPVMYDESNIIVGMSNATLSVMENETGSFTVYLGGITGTESTDVTLVVSTDGIGKPAIEGTDFTLSTKSVNVPVGIASVTVTPIDNDDFGGNKQFMVSIGGNSRNYPTSVQVSTMVTIIDDEHPLKYWIGTYTVNAASYGSPGTWDETWNVKTDVVPDDPTKLYITGISANDSDTLIATVDRVNMTIELESAQALGVVYGEVNGNVAVYYATDEIIALAGLPLSTDLITDAASRKIIGTIEADGTIRIDRFGLILTDYVWCYDVFNTTWIKN
jgi:hypothetical protein